LAQEIVNEDKIKASYVFNFIRFVTWPSILSSNLSSQKIIVCIINNHQFIQAFNPIIGRKVRGHLLVFREVTQLTEISSCNLVYIDQSQRKLLTRLLPEVQKYKILSISNIKGFCARGGIIGMVTQKGRIRVEINLAVAQKVGFNISSNLLEVATIVRSQYAQ
jgi:hypothetical protein